MSVSQDAGHDEFPPPFLAMAIVSLIAVSIPSIIIGRSVIGIELIIALLCIPFLNLRKECWHDIRSALSGPRILLLIAPAALWLPGLMVSSDPLTSFTTELRTLFYFIAGVALWSVLRLHRSLPVLCLRILIISSLFLTTIAVAGLLGLTEIVGFIRGDGWAEYNAYRYLKETASSASILIPVIVYAAYRLRGPWISVAAILVLELLAIIYLTASRSALAGVFGAAMTGLFLISLSSRKTKTLIIALVFIAIVVLGVFLLLQELQLGRWAYPGFQATMIPLWLIDAPRQAIWSYSWHAGEAHRWLGVGINVIDKLPGARDWNTVVGVRNIPLHPHSWIVEILVETGVIGFVAMAGSIIYCTFAMVRGFLVSGNHAVLAALCVWAAYWTSGAFNFSYWSSWWLVSFIIAMAICLASQKAGSKEHNPS
ncbi:MAG: O-antigen ligase family protein [Rhodospirillales bacterium]|nr:O-antigen ligase family protein [Rhodospirillales bacterium]